MMEKIKIGFVGAGKVGCSFGMLLKENQVSLSGFYSKNEDSAQYAATLTNSTSFSTLESLLYETDWLFLTVTDQQIVPVWEEILYLFRTGKPKTRFVFHCSGIHDSHVFYDASLYQIEIGSLHPLCAVHSKEQGFLNLQTSTFSMEGSVVAVSQAKSLCEKLHLSVVTLKSDQKVRYHAAAVFGSNLVLGLLKKSNDLFMECGFTKEQAFDAMMSLAKGNITNLDQNGFVGALTGPVERNDSQTVELHLEHLTNEEGTLYRILSGQILELAQEKHPDLDFGLIKEMLNYEKHSNINVTTKRTK